MARKFLYIMAFLVVVVISGLAVMRIWSKELMQIAFVPQAAFAPPPALPGNAYADAVMWYTRPGMAGTNPAQWQPTGAPQAQAPGAPRFAVFFVHPTSYLERGQWNAPPGDKDAEDRARLFLRAMASPFARGGDVWAPRYRQAALGAFLTTKPEAGQALNAAYADVDRAFAAFLAQAPADAPIVLAGHSQGAYHLLRLLREQVAGKPLRTRIAATYAIGWPISITHDLPVLGLPACTSPDQPRCIMSWASFAEPAEPGQVLDRYASFAGQDGKARAGSPILCTNPLNGGAAPAAPAAANLGTLKPDKTLTSGKLVPAAVPARCDARGLLLIGDPPEMGAFVLPGNDYHVYDIPLFWRNLQDDVDKRVAAWRKTR